MPARYKDYYYLTKPGIIYGNLMTAIAGFLFASKGSVDGYLLLATALGTALVIGSACAFNNYIDRHIDQKMARTRKRALVIGKIKGRDALIYATLLGLVGFLVLAIFTNWTVFSIGLAAFVNYVVIYGYVKRRSTLGTLVGTVPGAASIVAGYASVTGRIDNTAFNLFLILVCWQMPHFYAIAIRRLKDYKRAGMPVLPVRSGLLVTKISIIFYTLAFVVAITTLNIEGYSGYSYLIVMETLGLVWLWLAIKGFKTNDDTTWAKQMFLWSLVIILLLSVTLSLDWWLP